MGVSGFGAVVGVPLLLLALYCLGVRLIAARPTWDATPRLAVLVWWIGEGMIWALVATGALGALGVAGVGARAMWRVLG